MIKNDAWMKILGLPHSLDHNQLKLEIKQTKWEMQRLSDGNGNRREMEKRVNNLILFFFLFFS
jgi:hypothetical protein